MLTVVTNNEDTPRRRRTTGTRGRRSWPSMSASATDAFCFRLLRQRVARYKTYDVLDDNQLTAFLSRESSRLELRQLDPGNRLFASIEAFLKGVDVVENELLEPGSLPDPFGSVLCGYYETLDRYRS